MRDAWHQHGSVIFGRERGIGCADPFAPAGVLAKHLAWHVRAYQLFLMLTFKQA